MQITVTNAYLPNTIEVKIKVRSWGREDIFLNHMIPLETLQFEGYFDNTWKHLGIMLKEYLQQEENKK